MEGHNTKLYKFASRTLFRNNAWIKTTQSQVLARLLIHQSSIISLIIDLLCWMATIFIFDCVIFDFQTSQRKQNVTIRGVPWLPKSRRIYVKINRILYLFVCWLLIWPLLIWPIVGISFRLPSSVYININREEGNQTGSFRFCIKIR